MASEFEKKKERHASGESAVSTVSDYIPTPPDGGYGWVIVFASFVNHIIVDGIAFTFGVFYLEFLDFFGESKGKTALVGSLLCGCYLMTGPIASALTNKFGCRPVCVTGGVIATAAFVMATFSPNLDFLILAYGVLGGFGFGLIYLPSVISVSYYFEKRRAMATGIAVCGAGVGCFLFAPIGRWLMDTYDWKNALLITAGVVLNSCVMGMLMRPLEAPRRKRRPRRKNVLDRLREQTKLKHSESEQEEGMAFNKDEEIIERVQEVKLARERMLREEEGSEYSCSVPNSTVNSVRRLDRQDSRVSATKAIMIPESGSRHASLILPNSESMSPSSVPQILVEAEGEDEVNEKTNILQSETPTATSPSIQETSIPSCIKNGTSLPTNGSAVPAHVLSQRMQDVQGHPSLPSKVNHAGVTTINGHQNGNLLLPENGLRNGGGGAAGNKIKSAQDIWALQARKRQIQKLEKSDYARPMYRKDIFYSGSVLHIPEFHSQPNIKSYLKSTTSIPHSVPPEEEMCLWRCCPKSVKDILQNMLDVSLFKDPVFLIPCMGNAFGMLGLYVPFVFMVDRAIMFGSTEHKAAFLLSVIGITNTVGRIIAGFVADFKSINSLLLHNIAIILGGLACILNMFATTYITMCVFCAFFGLCVATWISLTSIILCDLMGLEKLTNAFGLLTLVRGICSIAGPPLAGMVFDATNDFNSSFHVGGSLLIVGGLLFCTLHLPFFRTQSALAHEAERMECDVPDFPEDLHLCDDLDPAPNMV